ncbi:MAG TPA: hypothetical protein VIG99_13265 [Myxococcaceae bacterium]
MTTRAGSLAAGAAAALALACGANPSTYVVALDQSGLAALPGSCYATGMPPVTPPVIQAVVQHEFTIWEGAQNKHYLRIDQVQVNFPSSGFNFNGLVEGGPKSWLFSTTANRGNNTTETRKMEFTFTDLSATLLGSVAVTDTFTCPTPPCGFQDCSVTLGLNGRQIQTYPSGDL